MKKVAGIIAGLCVMALVLYGLVQIMPKENTTQDVVPFTDTATYACSEEKVLAAGFSEGQATLVFDDGRTITLEQTVVASGVRYANEGDQVVLWTKGSASFVEENGVTTYRDCVAQAPNGAPDDGKTPTPDEPISGGEEPVSGTVPTGTASGGCFVGGCSSQICSDQPDMVSDCMWRESYACYSNATCGRQVNGACGWTETSELKACLAAKGSSL